MDLPVHCEQNKLSPIFAACYRIDYLSTCDLFAIQLLCKLILPLIQFSTETPRPFIIKVRNFGYPLFSYWRKEKHNKREFEWPATTTEPARNPVESPGTTSTVTRPHLLKFTPPTVMLLAGHHFGTHTTQLHTTVHHRQVQLLKQFIGRASCSNHQGADTHREQLQFCN